MPCHSAFLLGLAALTTLTHVQADSTVFSQYIGATTASAPSDTGLAYDYTICTNYLHGLPALTAIPSSLSSQLQQEAVDGVCQICGSVSQSRIDSCCAQATSSACFGQFAASNDSPTTPASVSATPTAVSGGSDDSSSTAASSSNAGSVSQVCS
jgi:hypothetical protein